VREQGGSTCLFVARFQGASGHGALKEHTKLISTDFNNDIVIMVTFDEIKTCNFVGNKTFCSINKGCFNVV
jgi:hypothetical protein